MAAEDIVVRAYAKINLSLRVLGVRADGYHELRTVFQSIALHDTLSVRARRGPFELQCDDPACPSGETNLVCRAARQVWSAAGRRGAVRDAAVRLTKRIPMAGGLGGGSSDAAATIRALGTLLKLPADRFHEVAASIGADVPYFLEGGTTLGLERGDLLFPLVDQTPVWVLLVVPGFGVSTKDAYGWLDRRKKSGTTRLARKGDEWRNDLQPPVVEHHPEIGRIVRALERAGAARAAMSGSGSTVFGLFQRREEADRARLRLAGRDRTVLVTKTVDRATYRRLSQ